jgi:hypothetical protein
MALIAIDIIKRAYRISNIVPLGVDPTGDQQTEALDILNSILISTVGNEAGDSLTDVRIGGVNDQSVIVSNFVPKNVRLVVNASAPISLDLDPMPQDGQRLAIVDVIGNFDTYNVTLNANGNSIEYNDPLVLDTADFIGQWIYQANESNWLRVNTLDLNDFLPFPDEFKDYFAIMLASQLDPSYGQSLAPETIAYMRRMKTQLHSRYEQKTQTPSDLTTFGWLSSPNKYYYNLYSDLDFDTGRFLPWR